MDDLTLLWIHTVSQWVFIVTTLLLLTRTNKGLAKAWGHIAKLHRDRRK